MAMYSAYFDESGHPDSGSYLVVAGCVASVDQWAYFEREWSEVLSLFGLDFLHTTDLHEKYPPYDKLSDGDVKDLLYRLVGIVCRRIEKTFSSSILLADYDISNQKYILAEAYGYPYPLAARNCLSHLFKWSKKYAIPDANIKYFFENGAKHKGQLEWIAERDKRPIPTFIDKKEATPLQAADLLAWSHHLHQTNNGKISGHYEACLLKLAESPMEWNTQDFKDPDLIPAMFHVPLRDPLLKYKCKIVKDHGMRKAVVQYWNKFTPELPINKAEYPLPLLPRLTAEDINATAQSYKDKKESCHD